MDRRAFLSGPVARLRGCVPPAAAIASARRTSPSNLSWANCWRNTWKAFAGSPIEKALLSGGDVHLPAGAAGRAHRRLCRVHRHGAGCDPEAARFGQLAGRVRAGEGRVPAASSIWTSCRRLGFNNSFAMVMRGDDARRLGVTTLSQLGPVAGVAARRGLRISRTAGRLQGPGQHLWIEVRGSAAGDGPGSAVSRTAEQVG